MREANLKPKTLAEQEQSKNFGCRGFTFDGIRAVEGEDRTYELSFSSEEPYTRWFGTEILDHSPGAVDLNRLNSIGVLLFNHDTDYVCGQILSAWISENRGLAKVKFDTDEAAELIHQKVECKTLKTTSVRYTVDSWEDVAANKTSADGKYTGPCSIARKWTPLEISIVSVPADPTVGVGRSFEAEETPETVNTLSISECLTQINQNLS